MKPNQEFNSTLNEDFTCCICYEKYNKKVTIEECGHSFCSTCVNSYLNLLISEGEVISIICPASCCWCEINLDLISSVISKELYEKYLRFKNFKEKESNLNFKWCPVFNCSGYDYRLSTDKLRCNVCDFEFCYSCSSHWHQGKCTNLNKNLNSNLKCCPKCKVIIEKSRGCPEMKCNQCGFRFCWICMQNLSCHNLKKCLFESKKDLFYIYIGLVLLLFPFCLLFIVPIAIFLYIDFLDEKGNAGEFLSTKWKINSIYTITTILSPIIASIGIPLFFLVFSTRLVIEMYRKILICNRKLGLGVCILSPLAVLLVIVLLILASLLICGLMPICGLVLLIFKFTIMIK